MTGLRTPSPATSSFSNTSSTGGGSSTLIPYYVLERSDGQRTKVLFLVPSALAMRLTKHPILCRGSCFELSVDENNTYHHHGSHSLSSSENDVEEDDDEEASFLAVDFESPYPDDLAREIAIRLTKRLQDTQLDQDAASRLYFLPLY
jgi:hypothetical protein